MRFEGRAVKREFSAWPRALAPLLRPSKKWPWFAVFAVIAGLHLTTVSREMGGLIGGDNVIYYLLGRAIATGQGYVDLYLPGHPANTQFPPLFPLLLAPFELALTNPLAAMHVMIALMAAGSFTVLGWWCGKRTGSQRMGLAVALVFAAMPSLYLLSANLLSEPLYMLVSYIAIAITGDRKGETLGGKKLAALTVLALAAFYTRTAGIALAAALAAGLAVTRARVEVKARKFPAWAVLGGVFVLAAGAWFLRNHLVSEHTAPYLTQFLAVDPYNPYKGRLGLAELLQRAGANVAFYGAFIPRASFTPIWMLPVSEKAGAALGLVVVPFIIAGLAREVREGAVTAAAFTLFSLAIALAWPYEEERFALPVLPLTCFYLLRGADWALGKVMRERGRWAVAGLVGVMLAAQAYSTGVLVADRFVDGREPKGPVEVTGFGTWDAPVVNWANYTIKYRGADATERAWVRLLTDYLIINRVARAKVPPGAVVMSRKPSYTYYLSGRECVPLAGDDRPGALMRYVLDRRVEYIVTGMGETTVALMVRKWPERFGLVAEVPGTPAKIVRVKPGEGS